MTVVERLFWQLGAPFSGRYRCTEVPVVERFKKESTHGLSTNTKKSGRCDEVATSGTSKFPGEETLITRDMCFAGGGTHITRDTCFPVSVKGTDITRDTCYYFPGGRTHITTKGYVFPG